MTTNRWNDSWNDTLHGLAKIFADNGVGYAVCGSGASVLHGVKFPEKFRPGDIDITSDNLVSVQDALLKARVSGGVIVEELGSESALTTKKFRITLPGRMPVDLDISLAEDFGFSTAKKVERNNVQVISLVETLLSIYLRPSTGGKVRPKDKFAAFELIKAHYEELNTSEEMLNHPNAEFKKFVLGGMKAVERQIAAENKHIERKSDSIRILQRLDVPTSALTAAASPSSSTSSKEGPHKETTSPLASSPSPRSDPGSSAADQRSDSSDTPHGINRR